MNLNNTRKFQPATTYIYIYIYIYIYNILITLDITKISVVTGEIENEIDPNLKWDDSS